jgi:hypothetical protein
MLLIIGHFRPLVRTGVDRRIILECILGKLGGKLWTEFIWLRQGPVVGSCENHNKPSGFITGEEFLD